jgi:hypothetical protein
VTYRGIHGPQAIASGVRGKLACTNHVKIDRPDKPPRSVL